VSARHAREGAACTAAQAHDALFRAANLATYVWRRDCDRGRRRRDQVEGDVLAMEEGLRLLSEAAEAEARPALEGAAS
jgi:hypothetical protein